MVRSVGVGLIEVSSFALLLIFGVSYIGKLIILLKKSNIKANVFGKGTKGIRTLNIEKCLKVITFGAMIVWCTSSLFPTFSEKYFLKLYENVVISILGLVITSIGVLFFILAMVFMKTSWRVGIDKSTKTNLITSGFYRFSRNPAFVGMNLMFLGTAITYGSVVAMIAAVLVIVTLHFQILQEEKHMKETFKKEYDEYAKRTARYLFF